jgi:hypothetical protein
MARNNKGTDCNFIAWSRLGETEDWISPAIAVCAPHQNTDSANFSIGAG